MNSFKSVVRDQVRQARANGITPPVIVCLWRQSRHAQAIHLEKHGRPVGGNVSGALDTLETMAVNKAVDLLRRHGEIGGAGVANLLERRSPEVRWWLLEFQEPSLTVTAFGMRQLFGHIVPYNRLLDTICLDCREMAEGRGAIRCRLRDGRSTVVCGATTEEAFEAIVLVALADSRCLPSLSMPVAHASLPLRDEDLSLILHRLFETKPRVVAEAIRALRKLPGCRDAWLTRVLDGTPFLSELAGAVRSEVGVEQPKAQ